MSLLDALSGGLTTATNAATAQQQGQLQGNQLAMMLQMRQAEMAKQRADTEQALAHAALFRHQNNQVLRGDLGPNGENLYANQLGTEKKTETEAETPALVDRTRQTLEVEDPFKRNFAQYQSNLEEQRQKNIEHLKAGLMDHYAPFQGTDANGQPIAVPFNTKTGGFGAPAQGVYPAGKGTLPPNVVTGMMEQAKEADQIMRDFEGKYATGQAGVGVGSSMLGGMADQKPNGIMGAAERALGNSGLAAANPDYQRYKAAQQRFGNIMGNLMSKRYSEYQGALDTDLSGIKGGDVNPTIHLKQSYRQDLLNHMPHPQGGAASTGAAAPPQGGDMTARVDAMIKAGKSDAEIRAALGTP